VSPHRDLKAEAVSIEHLMTHLPKNPHCTSCQRSKMQRKPCRRGAGLGKRPKNFGDQVTADHIVTYSDESQGILGQKAALVIMDRATGYLECYALSGKSGSEAYSSLMDFMGPRKTISHLYTDESPELKFCAESLGVPNGTSLPGRPQQNGVAERAVRSVVSGARTILEHAGLPHKFWPYAVRHWCFAHNIHQSDGNSPWHKRHKKGHFEGKILPFGCLVDFMATPEVTQGQAKFMPKAIPGVFLGYILQPGGVFRRGIPSRVPTGFRRRGSDSDGSS